MVQSMHIFNFNLALTELTTFCRQVHVAHGKICYISSLAADHTARGLMAAMTVVFEGEQSELENMVRQAVEKHNGELLGVQRLGCSKYLVAFLIKFSA